MESAWIGRTGRRIATGALSALGRPWVRRWARPGYFDVDPATMPPPRRAAVVACAWLGDSLWDAQVLPALRARWPDTEFTVFAKSRYRAVWRGFVPDDRLVDADAVVSDRRRERVSWGAIRRLARAYRGCDVQADTPQGGDVDPAVDGFDAVIDLTGNRYSAAFTFGLRPGWSLGWGGDEGGALYSRRVEIDALAEAEFDPAVRMAARPLPEADVAIPPDSTFGGHDHLPPVPGNDFAVHALITDGSGDNGPAASDAAFRSNPDDIPFRGRAARRPWRVLASLLGADAMPSAPRAPTPDSSFADAVAEAGGDPSVPWALIAPGAGWPDKRWAPEGFVAVARAIDAARRQAGRTPWTWAVTGSPAEASLCRAVADGIGPTARMVPGAMPLGRVFALLSGCAGFLGNDSGLGHVAAAYGRPTAAVFTGATDPVRYAPWGMRARAFVVSTRAGADAETTASLVHFFLSMNAPEREDGTSFSR